jgi:hypothetical protein
MHSLCSATILLTYENEHLFMYFLSCRECLEVITDKETKKVLTWRKAFPTE